MSKRLLTKCIVVILIAGAVVFYAATQYIDAREQEMVDKIIAQTREQEERLSEIATVTDRNGADDVVKSIVRDCSTQSRIRFDALLSRLGELSPSELAEIEPLYEACAGFFASRKGFMVARLDREYEYYTNLVELVHRVDDEILVSEFKTNDWKRLIELETRRSEIFRERVHIQRNIIRELQSGALVGSESIRTMMATAENLNEEVLEVNQRVDTLRKDLLQS